MTKWTPTESELAALGLTGAGLGEAELVPWSADPSAQGAGLREQAAAALFLPVALGFFHRAGAQIERAANDPNHVRIRVSEGLPVSLLSSSGTDAGWSHPEGRDDVVEAHLDQTRTVALMLPDGTHLLVGTDAVTGALAVCTVRPLELSPAAEIRPIPEEWLADLHDDWLLAEIRECLAVKGPWSNAVAAGLYGRLRSQHAGRGLELFQMVGSGQIDEELARARVWARGLNSSQLETIEELALAEVDGLRAKLDRLDSDLSIKDEDWLGELLELCKRRDEVDGVHLLLREAGAGKRLAITLASLDEEGALFIDSLPLMPTLNDEHLRRVAMADPVAWWAQPAAASLDA